ncbi:MAG: NfeD family protein [bacterium]|nr:NfeD family protein [bacterium]
MDSAALSAMVEVDWQVLALSLGLLVLAIALLVLEIFVVSFGVLLVASIASAVAAIHYAFAAANVVGWAMTVAVPVLAVVLGRWGLARIRTSRRLVPKSEITAEAGYHHHAEQVGVHPGAEGVMVTRARPSGRARFAGGECDVQVQSGILGRGEKVVVLHIDGPIVFVAPAADRESHDVMS